MLCPVSVIEIVEITRQTLVEYCRASESETAVATVGEARGIDGTGLRWVIELELVIGSDVAGSTGLILQD